MEFVVSKEIIYFNDDQGKLLAEVTFPEVRAGVVDIDHTFVDASLRGQGVAGQLMIAAYNEIKKSQRKAVYTCPYAVKWFAEHEEYQDISAE